MGFAEIGTDIFSPETANLGPLGLDLGPHMADVMEKFSTQSRNHIMARAGGASELSGVQESEMHAMHVDHTHDEEYDNPGRGMLVTPVEHLAYHFIHRGKAHLVGLSEEHNNLALRVMSGATPIGADTLDQYMRAVRKWELFLYDRYVK